MVGCRQHGTDLNPRSRQGSDRWAAKLGVPGYQYCLHPRTTGLVYCLRVLRGQRGIDADGGVAGVGFGLLPVLVVCTVFVGAPQAKMATHLFC